MSVTTLCFWDQTMNGGCQVIPVECPSWQSKMRILKDLTRVLILHSLKL